MLDRMIRYLVFGDVHLGNTRNKAVDIIKNIDEFFHWYADTSPYCDLDAIFVEGDLFDALISYSSRDALEVTIWMGRLMRFCSRHNIVLRFLKGTPKHDREQLKMSEAVYGMLNTPLDFRYIDTLHIEYISTLGLHVLYVPDEWTAETKTTLEQVKTLMYDEHLTQVDIAIMHGAFRYQLPMAPDTVPKHDESEYLSLVRYYINIGHVHDFSTYERIIASGSFDRMFHGEEDPKGATLMTLRPEGCSFEFIENKGAKIFKTVEVKTKDVDKAMKQVHKVVEKLPTDSYVRLKAAKDNPLYQAFDQLQIAFPTVNWSKLTDEDEEDGYQLINSAITLDANYTPVDINKSNIVKMIIESIEAKYSLSPHKLQILKTTLEKTNES